MNKLRKKLYEVMKNDFSVMAEHGDDENSLLEEIENATPEILETYASIFLS